MSDIGLAPISPAEVQLAASRSVLHSDMFLSEPIYIEYRLEAKPGGQANVIVSNPTDVPEIIRAPDAVIGCFVWWINVDHAVTPVHCSLLIIDNKRNKAYFVENNALKGCKEAILHLLTEHLEQSGRDVIFSRGHEQPREFKTPLINSTPILALMAWETYALGSIHLQAPTYVPAFQSDHCFPPTSNLPYAEGGIWTKLQQWIPRPEFYQRCSEDDDIMISIEYPLYPNIHGNQELWRFPGQVRIVDCGLYTAKRKVNETSIDGTSVPSCKRRLVFDYSSSSEESCATVYPPTPPIPTTREEQQEHIRQFDVFMGYMDQSSLIGSYGSFGVSSVSINGLDRFLFGDEEVSKIPEYVEDNSWLIFPLEPVENDTVSPVNEGLASSMHMLDLDRGIVVSAAQWSDIGGSREVSSIQNPLLTYSNPDFCHQPFPNTPDDDAVKAMGMPIAHYVSGELPIPHHRFPTQPASDDEEPSGNEPDASVEENADSSASSDDNADSSASSDKSDATARTWGGYGDHSPRPESPFFLNDTPAPVVINAMDEVEELQLQVDRMRFHVRRMQHNLSEDSGVDEDISRVSQL